jgi:protein involved in polysaccharide export with SLBB domain
MFKSILVTFFLLSFTFMGMGQSNWMEMKNIQTLDIQTLTNEQLIEFKKQASAKAITETDAINLLKTKGLSNEQAVQLTDRLQKLTVVEKSTEKVNSQTTTQEPKNQSITPQMPQRDLAIFGAELFSRNNLVFEPNIRIATPSSYVVGPDDELIVHVYGYSEMKYNLTINEDGEVYIQNVGPIFVSGLTIEQAAQKIKNKLASTIYRAIQQGSTKVQVRLGKIRSIRVTVMGEAYQPGTFTVSSLTSLFNLLYICGGPSDLGSYRNIEVIRNNKLIRTADLYTFLTTGNQSDNILLQEGDLIRIPFCQIRTEVTGNVRRPGKYEMKDQQKFADLLTYCGGFNELAHRKLVSVSSIRDNERSIKDVSENDFNIHQIKSGDKYFVRSIRDVLDDKISITGSVFRPGEYETGSTPTLRALLDKAGGFQEDAYISRINIFRTESEKKLSVLSVNCANPSDTSLNQTLLKGDSVHVYSVFDFRDRDFIFIEGSVRKPGKYLWRKNISLKELLLESGGINASGDSSSIEVIRKFSREESEGNTGNELKSFMISIRNANDSATSFMLEPMDIVHVNLIPGIIRPRSVLVMGEAMVPGKYSLLKSNERITDLIARMNGLKHSVDSNYVIIRRKRNQNQTNVEKELLIDRLNNMNDDEIQSNQAIFEEVEKDYDLISLNLKQVMDNPNSPNNILLESQDIIIFSKKTSMVRITGEVLYPMFMPVYAGKSMRFYIKKAGGFLKDARKSASYVVLPNGQVKKVKNFLFFRSYPRVTGKSNLIVPKKSKENKKEFSVSELAILASTLSIIANVIINLTGK